MIKASVFFTHVIFHLGPSFQFIFSKRKWNFPPRFDCLWTFHSFFHIENKWKGIFVVLFVLFWEKFISLCLKIFFPIDFFETLDVDTIKQNWIIWKIVWTLYSISYKLTQRLFDWITIEGKSKWEFFLYFHVTRKYSW